MMPVIVPQQPHKTEYRQVQKSSNEYRNSCEGPFRGAFFHGQKTSVKTIKPGVYGVQCKDGNWLYWCNEISRKDIPGC